MIEPSANASIRVPVMVVLKPETVTLIGPCDTSLRPDTSKARSMR